MIEYTCTVCKAKIMASVDCNPKCFNNCEGQVIASTQIMLFEELSSW